MSDDDYHLRSSRALCKISWVDMGAQWDKIKTKTTQDLVCTINLISSLGNIQL